MTQNEITDRQMLELAAKAYGLSDEWRWFENSAYQGYVFFYNNEITANRWNPLENNGDNFKLAVKLGLFLKKNVQLDLLWVTRRKLKDPDKFIRRSIVFCAAKIESDKNG